MLRSFALALASLAILTTQTWCRADEPVSLMATIAQWRHPGSKINGASMGDGATVNAGGERTVPSIVCKTVLTTTDPIDKVVRYYETKLKRSADSKPAIPSGKTAPVSGRSVACHDDSEHRPLAVHIILVNTDKSSTTLVITRAEKESETHIAWTHYVRF